jgi:hypothetical protein
MKFSQHEVYDLMVFDENENLVANLDSLKDVRIYYSESHETYFVYAKDALLNTDLLKFVGKENEQTDLQKLLSGNKRVISIPRKTMKNCKLIAKSLIRNTETELDQEIVLEFPKVKIVSKPAFEASIVEPSEFDVLFEVIPENDEFFKVHI